jgi:hypothetical protein
MDEDGAAVRGETSDGAAAGSGNDEVGEARADGAAGSSDGRLGNQDGSAGLSGANVTSRDGMADSTADAGGRDAGGAVSTDAVEVRGGAQDAASDASDAGVVHDVRAGDSSNAGDALGMTGGAGASGMSGGTAGAAGPAGAGGMGSAGGMGGAGGLMDAGGGSIDADGGTACGDVGQPCCGRTTCRDDLACLDGTTCSCVRSLHGHYIVRTDNKALLEIDDAANTQKPVLDGTTGLPLDDVVSIQEAYEHSCAVLGSARTVWCWRTAAGGNGYGQLGKGAMDTNGVVFSASQVLVAANRPLINVTALGQTYTPFYNSDHQVNTSCAVTADGHLYCWGDLTALTGNESPTTSPYAIPITSDGSTPLSGVLDLSISTDFACALLRGTPNNEVWCWGDNGGTEVLGQSDEDSRQYPAKVLGLTNPSKVVTGDSTVCAVDGGLVRCWGINVHGEAGVGSFNSPIHGPAPVVLMSGAIELANISDLSAGNEDYEATTSFCGVDDSAKRLLCWGYGYRQYASVYDALPEIVAVGTVDQDDANGESLIRALTSDGLYHIGVVARKPDCGP